MMGTNFCTILPASSLIEIVGHAGVMTQLFCPHLEKSNSEPNYLEGAR